MLLLWVCLALFCSFLEMCWGENITRTPTPATCHSELFCKVLFSSCACVAAIHPNQTQSVEGGNCFVLTIVLLTTVFYNRFLRYALTHTIHI